MAFQPEIEGQLRTQLLNKKLKRLQNEFVDTVFCKCRDGNEGAYVLTVLMQDYIKMLMMHLVRFLPRQEAKATMKVALDTILMDYGMHVKIEEFNSFSSPSQPLNN